jgi:hypothetical protein
MNEQRRAMLYVGTTVWAILLAAGSAAWSAEPASGGQAAPLADSLVQRPPVPQPADPDDVDWSSQRPDLNTAGSTAPPAAATLEAPTSQPNVGGVEWSKQRPDLVLKAPPEPELPAASKGPPLPFHTIEGPGGGAITPMAYLVNAGPDDKIFGLPSVAFSNVEMGRKNLQALTISETLFGRLELSYGLDRLGLGTLPYDIRHATGVDIDRDDVLMHNFNARLQLVKENSFDQPWVPAVTGGVEFKYNEGISNINDRLGHVLNTIGYDKSNGVDYTLTASKTLNYDWTFKRPLIASVGWRNSSAADLGFLGFADDANRQNTVEANVAYLPTDWLLVAYEYRENQNPFNHLIHGPTGDLIGKEDDWHAIDVSWIICKNCTLTGGWGSFGQLANTRENGAWFLQLKWEF